MSLPTISIPVEKLLSMGISEATNVHYQLSPEELTAQAVSKGQGVLNDTGALCVQTGEFTGRSPLDKFIVKDDLTESTVHWTTLIFLLMINTFNN